MLPESWRQRFVTSGVEFALQAFWVAVWGAVAVLLAGIWAFLGGVSTRWIFAAGGAFVAFLVVIIVTASLVLLRRRTKQPARVGRRGLFDSVRGVRESGKRLVEDLNVITQQMNNITNIASKTSERFAYFKAQAAAGKDPTDDIHKAATKAAKKLIKYGSVMRLRSNALKANVEFLMQCLDEWLTWALKEKQTEQLAMLSASLQQLLASTNSALPGMISFRDGTDSIRWIDSQFDIAGEDMAESMNVAINVLSSARDLWDKSLQRIVV